MNVPNTTEVSKRRPKLAKDLARARAGPWALRQLILMTPVGGRETFVQASTPFRKRDPLAAVGRALAARPLTMRGAPLVNRIERLVRRITNDRYGLLDLIGLSSLQVTVPGRHSGLPRTVTLLYVPDGENTYLLVGSNWGRLHHPQWTANLTAATEVTIRSHGEQFRAQVRRLSGAERERAWERAVTYWPGYLMEQQLAAGRVFRLFELIRR